MLETISLFIEAKRSFIFYWMPLGFGAIFYLALITEAEKLQKQSTFIPLLLSGGAWAFWNLATCAKWPKLPQIEGQVFVYSILFWLAGAGTAFVLTRIVNSKLDFFKSKTTVKTALARAGKTDVRQIDQVLPAIQKPFNPAEYWKAEGVFLGLGEQGEPVRAAYPLRHMQVTGTSGCGKGVLLSQIALEMAAREEAVFFIDPKNDEWAPSVCAQAKQPHYIDLNANIPQFNMFAGCSEREIYELFLAGFSLGEKGAESDFYRIKDRQAAKQAASIAFAQRLTAAVLHQRIADDLKDAPAFEGYLREMADVLAVNAEAEGLDLAGVIRNGGLVYVVGSMRNTEVIRMQRMLLVRLIQLAESRDRSQNKPRQICVVLDELKYHISRPAIEALGAARDKGMHVVLAYQSLEDLRDCPADLNGDAVVGAVFENTPIKITYRVEDIGIAKMLAEKSGKVQVDDETRMVEVGAGRVERIADKRSIRQTETYLIDQNMMHSLKPGQAVIFGAKTIPQFITTSPIPVEKHVRTPVSGTVKNWNDGAAGDISIAPLGE